MIDGTNHELNFWKEFCETPRFLDGWCSNTKTPELNNTVYNFITSKLPARVLDCGSGVCSILNGTVPNENLVVCDLLGNEYASIFNYAKYNIVQPLPYSCENLPFENEFDIVHISNALDHTQNPAQSYTNLMNAVKNGGYLIIQTFENEGKYENYSGLHQWNIQLNNNKLCIYNNKMESVFQTSNNLILASSEYIDLIDKKWLIFITQK